MKILNTRIKHIFFSLTLSILVFISACDGENSEKSSNQNSVKTNSEITETKKSDSSELNSKVTTEAPENNDEIYSGEVAPEIVRVVEAYKTGDTQKLQDLKELFVLDKAKEIINLVIKDGMTDYEKELAIHDYIVKNTHYDLDELDEQKDVDPDSFSAFGLLKNGKSVCLGYTRTFQLFMDILDIECLTIHSSAYGGEEHAWNMVKLDGEWYHVDVTWDDPIPDQKSNISHSFFNVTTKHMKRTEHEWDESKFPKATATKYKYK